MNQIKFFKPENVEAACRILAQEPDSMAVAGGTDLVVKIRNGMFPKLAAVVDISSLPLNRIKETETSVEIGSGCTMTQIVESEIVNRFFPVLAKAASTVGALQIRNLATIGGNSANASPAGDTIPALFSIDARVKITGSKGNREIAIEIFFTGPGRTALEKGEIIESFIIPKRVTQGVFLKLGERKAHAISKINLALSIWKEDTKPFCRISMGSVAPTVIRANLAEKFVEEKGIRLDEKLLEEAAKMVSDAARPISDVRSTERYRKQMAGVLFKRALKAIK